MQLVVVPTARAIRSMYQSHEDGLLPHTLRTHELFERITRSDYAQVSAQMQALLLFQASKQRSLSALKIPSNFYTFIENASYIVRFLEEMALEGIEFETLLEADTYAEYEEHLSILQAFKHYYKDALHRQALTDKMFQPIDQRFYLPALNAYEVIHFYIHGYISHYEQQLLAQIAEHITLILHIIISPFNLKMQAMLASLGCACQDFGQYEIDYTEQTATLIRAYHDIDHAVLHVVQSRTAQIGYLFACIEQWIDEGVDAESMVVVVPDESFAQTLQLYDKKQNFNYSMGFSIANSQTVQIFDALIQFFNERSVENQLRFKRVVSFDAEAYFIDMQAPYSGTLIRSLIEETFQQSREKKVYELACELIDEQTALFEHVDELSNIQALHLFIQALKQARIDDARGGKITVMGVLETRGTHFDHVVILDFNDAYVPKRSDKDLYINDATRKHANLPTQSDREALQKQYYYELLQRSNVVQLLAVDDYQNPISTFAYELALPIHYVDDDSRYEQILSTATAFHPSILEKEIILAHNVCETALSATKLASFLRCKRQYYYRYIEKIKTHEMPTELSNEMQIGRLLHQSIEWFFKHLPELASFDAFSRLFFDAFHAKLQRNVVDSFMYGYWKKKLTPFLRQTFEALQAGEQILGVEQGFKAEAFGVTLYGTIDRISQTTNAAIEIIDYKSSKVPQFNPKKPQEVIDFQMEFYALLYPDANRLYYYDLQTAKRVPYHDLTWKMPLLQEKLADLNGTQTIDFALCESHFTCQYCAYKQLCMRG